MRIDRFLGVGSQAMAILHILSNDLEGVDVPGSSFVETFAFYNGREHCAGVEAWSGDAGDNLILYFGEHRNSDSLFVQHSYRKGKINPPTVEDFDEESYVRRRFFPAIGYTDASNHVARLVTEHLKVPR